MSYGRTAIGVGMVAAGIGVIVWGTSGSRRRPRRRRHVVCPASPSADTSGLLVGDFVALTLRSADRKHKLTTWATVTSLVGNGRGTVRVRLTGEFGNAGVRMLPVELGYRLGEVLDVGRSCILEVYHPAKNGTVLCGQWLVDGAGKHAIATPGLVAGDEVQIWLAPSDPTNRQQPGPGFDVKDPVWAEVIRVSNAGHVVRVRVIDEPGNTAGHKAVRGDVFDVTRECITDRRA